LGIEIAIIGSTSAGPLAPARWLLCMKPASKGARLLRRSLAYGDVRFQSQDGISPRESLNRSHETHCQVKGKGHWALGISCISVHCCGVNRVSSCRAQPPPCASSYSLFRDHVKYRRPNICAHRRSLSFVSISRINISFLSSEG
jgi:hypothetical protein